jgi:hypothetical protein
MAKEKAMCDRECDENGLEARASGNAALNMHFIV